MSREDPWARHQQRVWLERARDPEVPKWLRIAFYAWGRHKANGHATFEPGELGLLVGVVNRATGELRPVDPSNLRHEICKAVEKGYLAEQSTAQCLVVPPYAISGGWGSEYEKCSVHGNGVIRWSRTTAHAKPSPPLLRVVV